MRTKFAQYPLALAAALLLTACATPDRVVLLPQIDGTPSAVSVQSKTGTEVVLAQPYATAAVAGRRIETGATSAAEVLARYKPVMDALPMRPKSYLVYFETGGDRLTAESEIRLEDILRDIKTFPAPEVVVIGHTDTVGADGINDEVSKKRAELIRTRLVEKGIDPARIDSVGRGKREPLVPTADGVAEPRNRRVEMRLK